MLVCKLVRFSGHVQGVGFRQTAKTIAGNFAVAGYVRNLPHGDVEMVVQGDDQTVQAYLQAISERMESFIRQRVEHDQHVSDYGEFDIRS